MTLRTTYTALSLWVMVMIIYAPSSSEAGQWDIAGQASLESRYFSHAPEYPRQKRNAFSPSMALEPEFVYEWHDASDRLSFTPFGRLDTDDKRRTHIDIREASWLHIASSWDISVGISKVFWGVAESVHLVDIINQTDLVEGISGEKKLGQAMVNVNFEQAWGSLSLFVLPGFRTRTFPADNARLHGPLVIDTGSAMYESKQKERHVDWALRWSGAFSELDVAISYFQGTSREARLLLQNRGAERVLIPYYDQIAQTGLELQLATDNTLWKSEAISRTGQGNRFYAVVGGFEHTVYGIAESRVDVGLLFEYMYDGRDVRFAPPSFADHDVFGGFRVAMNDTQDTAILLGVLFDYQTQAKFINLEAERRLSDHLKLKLNGRFFVNVPNNDVLALIRNDDFLELKLSWFF